MEWRWSLRAGYFVLVPPPFPFPLEEAAFWGRSPVGAGLPAELARRLVRLRQVHGRRVFEAVAPGPGPEADAAVTRRPGVALSVQTADCVPLLLAHPRGWIAAVHAGWRGLAAGVVEATVAASPGPGGVEARIGPAIGPCCYEVGIEVAERFPETSRKIVGGSLRVDLAAEARRRLEEAGVAPERVRTAAICTRCHQHLLPSHRGSGGRAGRLLAVIELDGGDAGALHRR